MVLTFRSERAETVTFCKSKNRDKAHAVPVDFAYINNRISFIDF